MSTQRTVRAVRIAGTGSYAPDGVLSNSDLEQLVETSDEWIRQRTGIRERRRVGEGEATSDLCHKAAQAAIDAAGVDPLDIGLVLVGTISPDMPMPSTACYLQRMSGATNAGCFDLAAACSGFVYGMTMAHGAIASGQIDKALVVGAESLTRFINYEDRGSCILFGDGAGAVVLEACDEGNSDILFTHMGSDGSQAEVLWIPGGGARWPASHDSLEKKKHYIALDGRAIYKFAVKTFVNEIQRVADACGVAVTDLDYIVPHQVNLRIIESAIAKLGYPKERVMLNIDRYGNTSAASVPMAFDEAVRAGLIQRGDLVAMVAFGAGLTWGSVAVRY